MMPCVNFIDGHLDLIAAQRGQIRSADRCFRAVWKNVVGSAADRYIVSGRFFIFILDADGAYDLIHAIA